MKPTCEERSLQPSTPNDPHPPAHAVWLIKRGDRAEVHVLVAGIWYKAIDTLFDGGEVSHEVTNFGFRTGPLSFLNERR